MLRIIFLFLLLAASGSLGLPPRSPKQNKNLITELRNAHTAVDRAKILAKNGNRSLVFDYTNPPSDAVTINTGGKFVAANGQTFPALTGVSAAMNLGRVAPCGVVATHIHPRADELVMVIQGRLIAQSITETGSVLFTNELHAFSATIFNQGAFHAQHNPDCTEAKFVASFNNNDPGSSPVAPNFFMFDTETVLGNLGVGNGTHLTDDDVESIRLHMPVGNFAVEACLKKCGLK